MGNRLPEGVLLIQQLLEKFVKDNGSGNFGFIISMYERLDSGEITLNSGCSPETDETYKILSDQIELMFKNIYESSESDKAQDNINPAWN